MAKLFAIKGQFSEKIYSKKKKIEYRRQNVNVKRGDGCYIYSSSPVRAIDGHFTVLKKIRLPLKQLWEKTKKHAGITHKIFRDYFKGCTEGTAIFLVKIKHFAKAIKLKEMQTTYSGFRPPQSYYELRPFILEGIKEKLVLR